MLRSDWLGPKGALLTTGQESDSWETKNGKHHRSEVCVEPNDAERHSLHESDAEISELESEILALKEEGKKLLILSEM